MKHIRALSLALSGLAILTISVLLSGFGPSHAAPPPPPPPPTQDVNVVNNPSVQAHQSGVWTVGSAQSGAWNVNSAQSGAWNVGATQSGTWNVGINGTPSVQLANNSPSNPVSVRDVNDPASQPFQRELVAGINTGEFAASDSLTVPAGKRLVLEFASETANLPAGQHMWIRIQTTTNGSTNQFTLTPSFLCACGAGGSDFLQGNQELKLYADPGSTVSVVANMFLVPANGNTGADVVMSGHYINVP